MSNKFEVPDHLLYTKDHEWAALKGGAIEVGITAFALDQLGEITLISINVKVGESVAVGQIFGTIESVKTVSDLVSPFAGSVTQVNGELELHPELVNEDCYGKGWMIVLAFGDPPQKNELLSPSAYFDLLRVVAG